MTQTSTPTLSNGGSLSFYKSPSGTYVNTQYASPSLQGGQTYTAQQAGLPSSMTPAPVTPPTLPSIPSPVVGGTSSPNAVFTSSAAKSDLAGKQAATGQLQQSMADQTAYKQAQAQQSQIQQAQDTAAQAQDTLAKLKLSLENPTPNGSPASTTPQATVSDQTDYTGALQNNLNQGNQLAQAHADLAQAALNGTIPLSAPQQAILNSIQATNAQLIAQQQLANKNYTAGVTATGIASGRNRYAPEIEQGNIQASINAGIQKISNLNNQNAETMAKLTEGFEQDNYKMINDSYAALDAQNKEKTTVLLDLQGKQQQALESARSYNLQASQDAITNKLNSDKFSFEQKNQVFDQAMRSAEFTEKQKMDMQDQYYKQQDLALKKADQNLKQLTFNAEYGAFIDPKTGQIADFTPENIPGVSKTSQGVIYFDPSNVNPKIELGASNAARKAGITVLDKADAPIVKGLSNSIDKLAQVQDAFNKIANPNIPGANIVGGIANTAGKLSEDLGYETQYQQNVDAYNSARAGLIQLASSLSTGGSKSIGAILGRLNDLIPPSTFGIFPGNQAGSDAKFTEARKLIYDSMRTYVPTAQLPQSGDKVYASLGEYAQAHPEAQSQAQTLAQLHPDWTSEDILKVLNN